MGVYIEDNNLVIITELKTIQFDLPKNVGNNLKYETDSIIKYNEILPEHKIKNGISQLLFKYKHRKDIHEPYKSSKPHRFLFLTCRKHVKKFK